MNFVQCEIWHLDEIKPYEGQFLVPDSINTDLRYAKTLLNRDGLPIACAGVYPLWDRVGDTWAVFSAEVLATGKLTLLRECKRHLDGLLPDPFLRLQSYALLDHEPAIQFLEVLGFKAEGIHPKMALGISDVVSFGRLA